MKSFAFFCVLFISSYVFAESTLPKGCQPITVMGESVTVQTKKNKLIFIHNITNTDLWITHPVKETGASAGWTSQLKADNWSALTVAKGPFILNCIESRPGHEQQIPCEGAIAVCQWNKVTFPANKTQTSFWAEENKSLSALTAAIGARGFVLPLVGHEK